MRVCSADLRILVIHPISKQRKQEISYTRRRWFTALIKEHDKLHVQLTADWSLSTIAVTVLEILYQELPHCPGFLRLISVITTSNGFPVFCSFRIICAVTYLVQDRRKLEDSTGRRTYSSHCEKKPANLERRDGRLSNLSFVPPRSSVSSMKNWWIPFTSTLADPFQRGYRWKTPRN